MAPETLQPDEDLDRILTVPNLITFVRLGRKVRIPESVPNDFISAGLGPPIITRTRRAA